MLKQWARRRSTSTGSSPLPLTSSTGCYLCVCLHWKFCFGSNQPHPSTTQWYPCSKCSLQNGQSTVVSDEFRQGTSSALQQCQRNQSYVVKLMHIIRVSMICYVTLCWCCDMFGIWLHVCFCAELWGLGCFQVWSKSHPGSHGCRSKRVQSLVHVARFLKKQNRFCLQYVLFTICKQYVKKLLKTETNLFPLKLTNLISEVLLLSVALLKTCSGWTQIQS